MQKDIFEQDYFGTLMCILVDESRRMLPTFNPTEETHKIQNDMCNAGSWIDNMPSNTIVESDPQKSIKLRNMRDKNRKHSPLLKHRDALEIHTGKLNKKGMIDKMSKHIEKVMNI